MIIGISGKAGSGKDEVTTIIQYLTYLDQYVTNNKPSLKGYEAYKNSFQTSRFKNVKFATKLKQILAGFLGVPVSKFEDRDFKNSVLSEEWWYYNFDGERVSYLEKKDSPIWKEHWLVKPTVRNLLQDFGTSAGRQMVHPDIWVNATLKNYTPNQDWIVSDVRFENELKSIEKLGGINVLITRPGLEIDNHESETDLENGSIVWDYIINNDGTIEDLIYKVNMFLKNMKIFN